MKPTIIFVVATLVGCSHKTSPPSAHTIREHHAGAGARTPPESAFEACTGQTPDASCKVALGGQTFYGRCQPLAPGVDEERLGCMPARRSR